MSSNKCTHVRVRPAEVAENLGDSDEPLAFVKKEGTFKIPGVMPLQSGKGFVPDMGPIPVLGRIIWGADNLKLHHLKCNLAIKIDRKNTAGKTKLTLKLTEGYILAYIDWIVKQTGFP